MKIMLLSPGDKVRIIQNAWENDCGVTNTLVATTGSIGTVLSYSDYCDYSHKHYDADFCIGHLELVKKCIDNAEQYPIRIETVVPPSEDFYSYWKKQGRFFIECEIGKVEILAIMFLEKIP
jgi:hypothetical protein